MMLRFLSILCGVAALSLAVFAAIQNNRHAGADGLQAHASAPQLEPIPVLQPACAIVELGDVLPDASEPFAVSMTNLSARAVRLVGAPDLCGPTGCTNALEVPKAIAAGETILIPFQFKAGSPGLVHLETTMLFDVGAEQLAVVPLVINGTIQSRPSTR